MRHKPSWTYIPRFCLLALGVALIPGVARAQKKPPAASTPPPAPAPASHTAAQPSGHPAAATNERQPAGGGNGVRGPVPPGMKPSRDPATAGRGPVPKQPVTPVKAGTVAAPDGGKSVMTPAGNRLNYAATGKLSTVTTRSGAVASFNSHGRVSTIHAPNGMVIRRTPSGARVVALTRPDGSRLVTTGPNRGYVQHEFMRGGQPYMRRTYVVNGRTYVTVYRGYYYGGYRYYAYVPPYYYGPAYYAWAYDPWGDPVAYTGWGWYGSPWYGYNAGYFAPYPAYPAASFWITDYVISQNLEAACTTQANTPAVQDQSAFAATPPQPQPNAAAAPPDAAASAPAASAPAANAQALTPEVKDEVNEEVKLQLAVERDAAANTQPAGSEAPPPPALDPKHKVFVVSENLAEQTADGQECSLTPGDVIKRVDDTPDKDRNVTVVVRSAKKTDCAAGSKLAVAVDDLQDMANQLQQKVHSGLDELARNQGKNGLPASPSTQTRDVAEAKAAPDLTAQTDVQTQQQTADQTEAEVQQAMRSGQGD